MEGLGIAGGILSTGLQIQANSSAAAKQRAFDFDMWKRQIEYNDPSNQLRLYRRAGLNPHMALTNGAIGSAKAEQNAGGQNAPQYDFSPLASAFSNAGQQAITRQMNQAQIDNLNAQTANQTIRNKYELQRQEIELRKMANDSSLSEAERDYYKKQADYLDKQISWYDRTAQSNINVQSEQAREHHANAVLTDLKSDAQSILNMYLPDMYRRDVQIKDAQIQEILAAAYEHNMSGALSAAEKALKDVDYKYRDKAAKALATKAIREADKVQDDNERAWLHDYYTYEGKAGQYFPLESGKYSAAEGYFNAKKRRNIQDW